MSRCRDVHVKRDEFTHQRGANSWKKWSEDDSWVDSRNSSTDSIAIDDEDDVDLECIVNKLIPTIDWPFDKKNSEQIEQEKKLVSACRRLGNDFHKIWMGRFRSQLEEAKEEIREETEEKFEMMIQSQEELKQQNEELKKQNEVMKKQIELLSKQQSERAKQQDERMKQQTELLLKKIEMLTKQKGGSILQDEKSKE